MDVDQSSGGEDDNDAENPHWMGGRRSYMELQVIWIKSLKPTMNYFYFLRPELSEAVASFDNLPVEFQLFVNVDITEAFLADPGGFQTWNTL